MPFNDPQAQWRKMINTQSSMALYTFFIPHHQWKMYCIDLETEDVTLSPFPDRFTRSGCGIYTIWGQQKLWVVINSADLDEMGIQIPVIVRDQRSRKANCSGQWAHIIEEKAAATAKVKTLQLSTFF